MSRVGRNNSPTKLNAFGLAGDDSENRSRRARFKRMFTPPRIGFGDPERVETRVLTGLGHGQSFADGLHAKLKDSDIEWNSHSSSGLRSQVSGLRKNKTCSVLMRSRSSGPIIMDF